MNEQNNRTMMPPSERLEAIFSLTLAATIAQVILSYDLVTDMIGCASFAIVGLSTATLFVILMRYFQIRVSGRQISELSFFGNTITDDCYHRFESGLQILGPGIDIGPYHHSPTSPTTAR